MSIHDGIAVSSDAARRRQERVEEIQDTIDYTDPAVTRSQSAKKLFEGKGLNPKTQHGQVEALPSAIFAHAHPTPEKQESGEVFIEKDPVAQAKDFLEKHQIQKQEIQSGTAGAKTGEQAVKIHASSFVSSLPPEAQQQYSNVLQHRHISIHSPKVDTPKPDENKHFFPGVQSPSTNSHLMSPISSPSALSSPSSLGASPSSIGHTMVNSPSSVNNPSSSPSKQRMLISPQSVSSSPIAGLPITIHPPKVGGTLPHEDLVSFSSSPSSKSSKYLSGSSHKNFAWKALDSFVHLFSKIGISKSNPPSLPVVSKPENHLPPGAEKKEDSAEEAKTREEILKRNLEEAGLN